MASARAILHLDMDAFYASVEQRDDPRLRGQPTIVGGDARRGVVLAASYEVRKFGVRSAMPMVQALRLCPGALVVAPRFSAYVEASEQVQAIFAEVTPLIEPLSLDEAFLDVTGSLSLFGPPAAIALRLRQRIAEHLALPASAGIARNKFVAKIASDLAKPNGQREVPPDETEAFLAPLPLGRLWGVGPKTEANLRALGLRTIGDLRARGEGWLGARLGEAGKALHALACGLDDRPVVADRQPKSVGAEDTFATDERDLGALRTALHAQAWRVGRRLRQHGLCGRVVELKLKFADFEQVQRQRSLPLPSDDGQAIHAAVLELFARASEDFQLGPAGRAVRLTGVAVGGLTRPEARALAEPQADLFATAARPQDQKLAKLAKLNQAIDRIAAKYGSQALLPADLERAAHDPERPRRDPAQPPEPSSAARPGEGK